MTLPTLSLRLRVFLFFALLVVATPTVIGMAIWLALRAGESDSSRLLFVYIGFSTTVIMLLTVLVWQLFDRHIAGALLNLARQMQTSVHTDTLCAPDTEPLRYLGPLGSAVNELATTLHTLRERRDEQFNTQTAVIEARQLAAILRDLDTGVLVMNLSHEILLYNHKALSFLAVAGNREYSGASITNTGFSSPGLARPVQNLLRGTTIRHAVEHLLAARDCGNPRIPLMLSPVCVDRLLQGTVGLVRDTEQKPIGYVLVFDDVTSHLADAIRRERQVSTALNESRLHLDRLLTRIKADESDGSSMEHATLLRRNLDDINTQCAALTVGDWPMASYLSSDLVENVVDTLNSSIRQRITRLPGNPSNSEQRWLCGNIYLLESLLKRLLGHICKLSNKGPVVISQKALAQTLELHINWNDNTIDSVDLDEWLESSETIGPIGLSLRQILDLHGTGIEYRPFPAPRSTGEHALTITLGAYTDTIALAEYDAGDMTKTPVAARPEFYDFDLFTRKLPSDSAQWVLSETDFVVFDTETTGLRPSHGDEMISIGGVRIVNGRVLQTEYFNELINPGRSIPDRSIEIHGITNAMVEDKPDITEVLPRFAEFIGDSVLVAHNAAFDMKFIELKSAISRVELNNPVLDTVLLSSWLHDHSQNHTLDELARRFGISVSDRHSALGDAMATARVFVKLIAQLASRDVHTLEQALNVSNRMVHIKRQQKAY